jgi:hypothetical protein
MPEDSCAQLLRPWWNAWPAEGRATSLSRRRTGACFRLPESPDQGIGLNVFSHLSAATKLWADVSIKMITEVMLAIMQKDLQEQSGTDARDPFVSHNGVD